MYGLCGRNRLFWQLHRTHLEPFRGAISNGFADKLGSKALLRWKQEKLTPAIGSGSADESRICYIALRRATRFVPIGSAAGAAFIAQTAIAWQCAAKQPSLFFRTYGLCFFDACSCGGRPLADLVAAASRLPGIWACCSQVCHAEARLRAVLPRNAFSSTRSAHLSRAIARFAMAERAVLNQFRGCAVAATRKPIWAI